MKMFTLKTWGQLQELGDELGRPVAHLSTAAGAFVWHFDKPEECRLLGDALYKQCKITIILEME